MSFHDEPFMPEEIDEQIERLLQMPSPQTGLADSSTQLVHELRTLAKDDEARLQRIRTRLTEHASEVIVGIPLTDIQDYQDMRQTTRSFLERPTAPRKGKRRLVAALVGLVALLVITSSGVVFVRNRLFISSTLSGAPGSSSQSTQSPTSAVQDINAQGLVYPLSQSVISFPVAERVINVMVKPGDQVTLKQPLIQLDPVQLNAQVQQAQGAVEAAQAKYNTVLASGTAANIANAQQQLADAKNRLAVLQSQVNSPFINNGNLLATQAGFVTQVSVNPGDVLNADQPLIIIMDESKLVVHAKIPLSNLGMVKLHQPAVVMVSALPGVNIQGTVYSIIPQADPQTNTFEVWVQFDNLKTGLRFVPGMSASVRIQKHWTW